MQPRHYHVYSMQHIIQNQCKLKQANMRTVTDS